MEQASGGVVNGQKSCSSRVTLNAREDGSVYFRHAENVREHAAVAQPFLNRVKWNAIMIAPDFASYSDTPLPVDQKLLTLLHFNLLRALTRNILLLGINPFHMELDIESPFAPHLTQPIRDSISLENLPPTLRPTMLQKTVRHHPEIDVLPFPTYRDNLLLNGAEIDEEVCTDMMYGVVEDNGDGLATKRTCHGGPFVYGGRTGLIVWDEPWKQSSWEVDEKFARKWKKLLVGCQELLQSTNRWRAVRGEPALILDD
jgi:hypothetical protein